MQHSHDQKIHTFMEIKSDYQTGPGQRREVEKNKFGKFSTSSAFCHLRSTEFSPFFLLLGKSLK